VPLNVTQHWKQARLRAGGPRATSSSFCAGTFTDLHQAQVDKQVGFGAEGPPAGRQPAARQGAGGVRHAGPSCSGESPCRCSSASCPRPSSTRFLTAPPDSLVEGVPRGLEAGTASSWTSREDALRAVVQYAVDKRLGARGLRRHPRGGCSRTSSSRRRSDAATTIAVDRALSCEARLSKLDGNALREK